MDEKWNEERAGGRKRNVWGENRHETKAGEGEEREIMKTGIWYTSKRKRKGAWDNQRQKKARKGRRCE